MTSASQEKNWNNWRDESFWIFIIKEIELLQFFGKKVLREWIDCLVLNVAHRLLVAIRFPKKDRREQTLRLDTSQQAQLRVQTLYLA